MTWKVYAGSSGYPVSFYTQLKGSANIVGSDQIVADAAAGALPTLAMVWHDSPYDEHPVADVSLGQDKVWQAVDAIAAAGLWPRTVFLLTWDDWGGWDDHVVTPNLEFTPDSVQVAYGPRVPLLMFGGPVKAASIPGGTPTCPSARPCLTCSASRRWACRALTTPLAWPTWSTHRSATHRHPRTAARSPSPRRPIPRLTPRLRRHRRP